MEGLKSFIHLILSAMAFVWELFKAPVSIIGGAISRILGWYKEKWIKFTHNKYDEFVYKRGMVMAASTIVALIVLPTLLCLFLRTGYYLATYKKEKIFLIQSEEIYPDENTWAVRGCYTQNCDSESSLYYRIEPTLFHQLWSLSHEGNIFLPDAIGSSVPTGLTQCEVVSYGVRLRMLMTFNIYPSILKITCDGYRTPDNDDKGEPGVP